MAKFNKYRKKTRYKKFQFKLTEQQNSILESYCEFHKITSVKAIKKILLAHLADQKGIPAKPAIIKAQKNNANELPKISKNQLNLFDLIEAERTIKRPL